MEQYTLLYPQTGLLLSRFMKFSCKFSGKFNLPKGRNTEKPDLSGVIQIPANPIKIEGSLTFSHD
ncbi:hypothetical protein LEP3755_51680 [Leptolyngbya sp. NIES-3755]|nr:hypothetical protein LEP3755_51680 [Leptolyngbya sp. NIES-3755]